MLCKAVWEQQHDNHFRVKWQQPKRNEILKNSVFFLKKTLTPLIEVSLETFILEGR